MNDNHATDEFIHLLDAMCNEQLDSARFLRLQELLRDNPAAQQTYLSYFDLHLGLKQIVAVESGEISFIPKTRDATVQATVQSTFPRRRPLPFGRAILASSVFIVSVIAAAFVMIRNNSPVQETLKLTAVSGNVSIDNAGRTRVATAGTDVTAGARINTRGAGASAIMEFEDGTRLVLVNDSAVSCLSDERKSLLLHYGIVSAQVSPQPKDRPMLLATPGAKIEVLGTQFAIATTTERTEVNVTEGRVRLTRVSDGRSVEVVQGQGVVTNGEANLTVRESSGPRDEWEVDFERGIPKGWTGSHVTTGLPAGSAGAIQSVRDPESNPVVYVIGSRDEWLEGMFEIHEDSHLHFTIKMQHPDWLNVFISTRGADAMKPTWALHNFNEVPFWPPQPGQWRTVTIPLSKFRRKREGKFHDEPPVVGEIAYSLSISATEPDRGLVVDRIWATRGGPGKVEWNPSP